MQQAQHIQWTVEAEIKVPALTAQLRSYFWPTDDAIRIERELYYVTQYLSPGISAACGNSQRFAPLPTGSFGMFPSRHALALRMRPGWRKSFVCLFDPTEFEQVTGTSQRWNAKDLQSFTDIRSPSLRFGLMRIRRELLSPGLAGELAVEGAAAIVMVDFARYLGARSADGAVTRTRGLAPWQLRILQERIEQTAQLGVPTLRELAGLCRCSCSHLMHNFKASTGVTVHKAIEQRRIKLATELLEDVSLSIKQVAFELGFSSQAYFTTAFKRATTMTPLEYRRTVGAV